MSKYLSPMFTDDLNMQKDFQKSVRLQLRQMLGPLLIKFVDKESALFVYIWISTCWRMERSWVGEERICFKWCDREKPHMASLGHGKGSRLQGSCGSRGNNYLWKVGQFWRIWDGKEKNCVFLKDNKRKHQIIQAIKTYWTKLKSVKQEKDKRLFFLQLVCFP